MTTSIAEAYGDLGDPVCASGPSLSVACVACTAGSPRAVVRASEAVAAILNHLGSDTDDAGPRPPPSQLDLI